MAALASLVALSAWACGAEDESNPASGEADGAAGSGAADSGVGGSSGQGGSSGSSGSSGSGGGSGSGGSGAAGPDAGGARFDCASQSGPGTVIEPGSPGASDVVLSVRSDQQVHAISPLIYGLNGVSSTSETRDRPTLSRSGGNRMTAYNWETNASNAGSDYQFQNDGYLSDSEVPGEAVRGIIEFAKRTGGTGILTVPIVDYVSADKNGGGDVRQSGSDYLATRFRQNLDRKGAAFSLTPDANDDFVYQDEFVNWAKTNAAGADVIFSLDNEPDLWSYTHAEVHPEDVTYAELVERNTRYAKAIKAVWPETETLGFVSYGWYGYEALQDAPDSAGNGVFVEYYLTQMKAAADAHGSRLIDYLDLHWYPEARGGGTRITEADNTSAVVAARVQAPRSLWDASYVEDSWIAQSLGNQPIRLLPLLRERVAANYPGTKLAFTEWNYGGGNHISGAIASADALGIFGRECVALAAMWPLGEESFTMAAFQVFRNYDGAGSAFGDTSISADSSADDQASVYASFDAADPARVVIVAINKQTSARTAALTIAHPTAYSRADVFRVTSAAPTPQAAAALTAVAANAFSFQMPALSISVIVPEP